MYESIYILYVNDIYHDSTWKHLRQPCANLAPSLNAGKYAGKYAIHEAYYGY